jgi:hypothetical protein
MGIKFSSMPVSGSVSGNIQFFIGFISLIIDFDFLTKLLLRGATAAVFSRFFVLFWHTGRLSGG